MHHEKEFDKLLEPRPMRQLDRLHTSWYSLCCLINREWKKIKGLQIRERTWKTLEFIVRRVDNPDEEVQATMEERKMCSVPRRET